MGHEDVTGTTYEGTTTKHLEDLVYAIASQHREEEGMYHSVNTWYRVIPGVTTPREFFRHAYEMDAEGGSSEKAQLIYAEKDVKVKTFRLTLPVKNLTSDLSHEKLEAKAREAAEAKGLIYDRFAFLPQEGEIIRGVTGETKVATKRGKGALRTLFQVVDTYGHVVTSCSTQAEAEAEATSRITAALERPTFRGIPTYTLRKVTEREEGPLAEVSVTLTRGKAHLEVTGLQVKAGAKAGGWAVSLDCHH